MECASNGSRCVVIAAGLLEDMEEYRGNVPFLSVRFNVNKNHMWNALQMEFVVDSFVGCCAVRCWRLLLDYLRIWKTEFYCRLRTKQQQQQPDWQYAVTFKICSSIVGRGLGNILLLSTTQTDVHVAGGSNSPASPLS